MNDKQKAENVLSIKIRKASPNDIDEIIRICSIVFTHDVRYQIPHAYQRPWFLYMINTPIAEVYVATQDTDIVGFIVIVLNLSDFEKENIRKNKPIFWLRFVATLSSVEILVFNLINKCQGLMRLMSGHMNDCACASDIVISYLAVLPKYQRKGIARDMLSFIERRAVELNLNTIQVATRKKNSRAISLYESYGYRRTIRNDDYCQFIELKKSLLSDW